MIMLSFNMAAPDLLLNRSCWVQQGDVSEVTARATLADLRHFPPNDGQKTSEVTVRGSANVPDAKSLIMVGVPAGSEPVLPSREGG
jgi:hypothetical protein